FACDDAERAKDKASETAEPTAAEAPTTPSAPSATSASAAKAPPDAIAAQHVLVAYKGADSAPKGVTRAKTEAKKLAEEIAAKARAGEPFEALVATHSDDLGSKERLGSLGKFTREKMVKPFADAAFALEEGAISPPVETKFGFHVIKRNQ